MAQIQEQSDIDRKNAEFWDELCGTQLAKSLGVTDNSAASLKKFDDWYFDFYPYLYTHIPFAQLAGKAVLEVGLGFGTVAQKLLASGANYHGLDIAAGPVAMVQHRADQLQVHADIRQGSVLAPAFDLNAFDWVIAIGCLHHTGNLGEAIEQVHGLLRPGGQAMIMVYSAYSYRQLLTTPLTTIKRRFADPAAYQPPKSEEKMRGAYDRGEDGTAAPQTEFVTKAELQYMCRAFKNCKITAENIGSEGPFRMVSRKNAIKYFGSLLGLDLYCHVMK